MALVTFITSQGDEIVAEGSAGDSLMQIAVMSRVPGITGDCGGCCSCATCHVYVPPEWQPRLPAPAADEAMMLTGCSNAQQNSRLACQIRMSAELDGMVLQVPETSDW
jgi:ferredoxin, 2Fe-2S